MDAGSGPKVSRCWCAIYDPCGFQSDVMSNIFNQGHPKDYGRREQKGKFLIDVAATVKTGVELYIYLEILLKSHERVNLTLYFNSAFYIWNKMMKILQLNCVGSLRIFDLILLAKDSILFACSIQECAIQ